MTRLSGVAQQHGAYRRRITAWLVSRSLQIDALTYGVTYRVVRREPVAVHTER